jgi:hypothetical protein
MPNLPVPRRLRASTFRHDAARIYPNVAEAAARFVTERGPYRVSDVATLMRHAQKSATYKPALLKALVRCSQKFVGPELPLETLGAEFARLYWNQTVVYHLRQASALSKEAGVVKLIRETANTYQVRALRDLPPSANAQINRRMASLLQVNVLAAFHRSKPERMRPLFAWEPGSTSVTISETAREFLQSNALPLELIGNYYWADMLESCNQLAPRIIQKVSLEAASRSSLQRYLRILRAESDDCCFYCGCGFDNFSRPTVDHVIPWSFLLEDPPWDLVLACARCNSQKSDWLPAEPLIQKLIRRNLGEGTKLENQVSFLFDEIEISRLYEAAISVEWPRFWSPR